jgi:hypothetical protein
VDVVRDLMIHDLDMILSFNLGPIEDVQAAGVGAPQPSMRTPDYLRAAAGQFGARLSQPST